MDSPFPPQMLPRLPSSASTLCFSTRFQHLQSFSSAITHVSITQIQYKASDEFVYTICILRARLVIMQF